MIMIMAYLNYYYFINDLKLNKHNIKPKLID